MPGIAVLLASACGNPGADGIAPMTPASPDYVLAPVKTELIAGTPDDVLEIARTFDTVLDGETFLVADFGNDRIVRLDTGFTPLHAFGTSGSGPGELKGPSRAVPWNDEIVVGDWNNNRFAIFHRDGHHLRTLPAGGKPESFGVFADGRIVMPSARLSHYTDVLEMDGTVTPFAARPAAVMADSGVETLGGSGSIILVGRGDTTHVLDNEWGVLAKYAPAGDLILARSIPGDILEEMRSYRSALVQGLTRQGHRVVAAPLLKTMSFADDGSIVIMITRGNTVALRVDPADYSVQRITAPVREPMYALVRSATSVLILNEHLFVFSSSGLASFPLMEDDR